MKKNIHILLAATLLFGATSCEDFLQKDSSVKPFAKRILAEKE